MVDISFDTLFFIVKAIILTTLALYSTAATKTNRKRIVRLWLNKGKINEEHLLLLDGSIKTNIEMVKYYDNKEFIAIAAKTLLILFSIGLIAYGLALSHSYLFMLIHLIASSVLLIKRFRKNKIYKSTTLKPYMCRATE